jgi:hypothetical protein
MSTGYECQIIELEPDEWYYLLQDWNCPVGAWDWREYATMFGPFRTYELAEKHLSDYHANPGGWSVLDYDEKRTQDPVLQALAKTAKTRRILR